MYCIGLCTNAAGFIISRLFIGFSLATFVACQFWCTSMFNTKVVGAANAVAAGWVSPSFVTRTHSLLRHIRLKISWIGQQRIWGLQLQLFSCSTGAHLHYVCVCVCCVQGNMGGGFTHFLMPLVFDGIKAAGSPAFQVSSTQHWAGCLLTQYQHQRHPRTTHDAVAKALRTPLRYTTRNV